MKRQNTVFYFFIRPPWRSRRRRRVNQKLQIMQNKPNFKDALMDVTTAEIRCYEKWTLGGFGKTKPKTNPKQSQFKAKTNPILSHGRSR
jgi:hypothetical protein